MILGLTLPRTEPPALYTYPARPLNGGPFEKARPKPGRWAAEPKFNGWRALIHVPSDAMFNRHGERLSIASEFESSLEILRATLDSEAFKWVDCEALDRRHELARGTLIVLDVIPEPVSPMIRPPLVPCAAASAGCRDKTPPDYLERRSWLTPLAPPLTLMEVKSRTVYLTPSTEAIGHGTTGEIATPRMMWAECRAANQRLGAVFYEGIVMKRLDSLYPIQTRSAEETTTVWVKHRWRF